MLPRSIDETHINITAIFDLLQKMYAVQDFNTFARVIRHFQGSFTPETLSKSFQILVEITSQTGISPVLLYQSAVCLKKMLG